MRKTIKKNKNSFLKSFSKKKLKINKKRDNTLSMMIISAAVITVVGIVNPAVKDRPAFIGFSVKDLAKRLNSWELVLLIAAMLITAYAIGIKIKSRNLKKVI